MSIQRFNRFAVSCDICHTTFDEAGDHIIHFDTELEAINYVADYGWTITDTGSPICNRCAVALHCQQDDHAYSDWIPCYCRGHILDHALFGLRTVPLLPPRRLPTTRNQHPRAPTDNR